MLPRPCLSCHDELKSNCESKTTLFPCRYFVIELGKATAQKAVSCIPFAQQVMMDFQLLHTMRNTVQGGAVCSSTWLPRVTSTSVDKSCLSINQILVTCFVLIVHILQEHLCFCVSPWLGHTGHCLHQNGHIPCPKPSYISALGESKHALHVTEFNHCVSECLRFSCPMRYGRRLWQRKTEAPSSPLGLLENAVSVLGFFPDRCEQASVHCRNK